MVPVVMERRVRESTRQGSLSTVEVDNAQRDKVFNIYFNLRTWGKEEQNKPPKEQKQGNNT